MPSNDARFRERHGPVGLVLGGSEGIGAAFAHRLAARGLDVVLVALPEPALDETAAAVRARHGVDVRPLAVDLTDADAVDRVATACDGLEVGCLVYNAGVSTVGPFLAQPVEVHERLLDLNARGPLRFVHRFAPAMVARGRGGVVLLSSMAALQGAPDLATYAATKAFDLVLAESLWAELGPKGVDVLACVVGATDTPGWRRAGADAANAPVMTPDAVAEEALAALGRTSTVVTGWKNRLATAYLRLRGREAATRTIDAATRPMRQRR